MTRGERSRAAPSGAGCRVLLLRHGESEWNADGRWQGQADPALSPLGEAQAAAAAGTLTHLDAVYASDLIRAHRTAEVLGEPHGLAPRVDARLRERHAGEWTGLTRPEIEMRWPGYLAARRGPPGFEDDDSVLARALATLAAIGAAVADGAVVAVSHGGLIRTVERHLGADAPPVPNLGGRWVVADAGRWHAAERQLLVDPDEVEVTVPGTL